jgi:hypothetical protein
MHERYLEITFRRGKPIAAYLYLPRLENDKSCRVAKEEHDLLVDLAEDGRPIGIEILSPNTVTMSSINEILTKYSLPLLDNEEVAPLEPAV